ncbi:MAG: ATP-binding protein [Bacteroidales bacterium]|nr:ATP-binding protein [Bacteroidales bacterium]
MTQNYPKLRKSYTYLFLLVLILVISTLVLISRKDGLNGYKRFEALVHDKSEGLEKLNNCISKDIFSENNPDFLFCDSLYMAYAGSDVILNVYIDSHLLYWSDIVIFDRLPANTNSTEILNTANAVCLGSVVSNGNRQVILAVPIENQYQLSNPFFASQLKSPFKKIAGRARFSKEPGSYNVLRRDGRFWFSLKLWEFKESGLLMLFLQLVICFLGFIALSALYKFIRFRKGVLLSNLALIFGTIGLWLFSGMLLETLPARDSIYYSSEFFASNILGNSLAHFFITAVFLTFLVSFVRKKFISNLLNNPGRQKLFSFFSIALAFFLVFILGEISREVVINTRLNLDIANFSNWNSALYVFITALLIYYLTALWLITRLFPPLLRLSTFSWIFFGIVSGLFAIIISYFHGWEDGILEASFAILVVAVLLFFRRSEFRLQSVVSVFVLCSVLFAFNFIAASNYKDDEKLKVAAKSLFLQEFEPQLIYMFDNLKDSINDLPPKFFLNKDDKPLPDETIQKFLYSRYFSSGYWDKYDIQLVVCDSLDVLSVKPDFVNANCLQYFQLIIESYGRETPSGDLHYVDYGQNFNSFIGIIRTPQPQHLSLILEFIPRFITREGSYPELLAEKSLLQVLDISSLSMARYKSGRLISYFGENSFPTFSEQFLKEDLKDTIIDKKGHRSFVFRISAAEVMIIGTDRTNFFRFLNVFSYSFVFVILHALFISIVLFSLFPKKYALVAHTDYFQTKVQRIIFIILAISFLVLGVLFSLIIIRYNYNKNKEAISEKSHSILSEFQYKFRNQRNTLFYNSENLNSTLIKLSDIFSSDINVFNAEGVLLGSSKPQIFEKGLLPTRINSTAFRAVKHESASFFLHSEKIGNQEYLSAYYPFLDFSNQVIAIINVPFFDTGKQLNQSLSGFYASFIVIYVILLILSFYLVLFLARQISKPLKTISYFLSKIKLEKQNEKIPIQRNDEIGLLIAQYNIMVEELEKSRDLITKAEREKAWRDIARQLAHEIKNPLTPIKLGVQHLIKAWDDKDPDWDARLRRFSKNLQDQIHVLDTIVSEFSTHAKLAHANKGKTDVLEIARVAMMVLSDFKGDLQLSAETGVDYFIWADKVQLTRAINNILKNSVQSIPVNRQGSIIIGIQIIKSEVVITIQDNGCGIDSETSKKVFSPYFTTKASGTGLGLVMTKEIVEEMDGKIDFHSVLNEGTTFTLRFPAFLKG